MNRSHESHGQSFAVNFLGMDWEQWLCLFFKHLPRPFVGSERQADAEVLSSDKSVFCIAGDASASLTE